MAQQENPLSDDPSGFRRSRSETTAVQRFHRVSWGSVVAAAFTVSCATVFLQDDGFRAKLAEGCHTEEACRVLVDEAAKRTDACKDNTVGYVRCDEASADLAQAKSMLAQVSTPSTPVKTQRTAPAQNTAPTPSASADEPTREGRLKELNAASEAREGAERERQAVVSTELQSNRCTDAHAEHLRRVLDQAVDLWRNEPLQVVSGKLVVLTENELAFELSVIIPGEYHVFVIQPERRAPRLAVHDADGYEVKQGSEWGGYFAAGGTAIGGQSRRVQWIDPSQPIVVKTGGQGCAMIVLVHRLW